MASPLRAYLDIERPSTSSEKLFLSLKGPNRGLPLTPAGLRKIFRYHRKRSRVLKAIATVASQMEAYRLDLKRPKNAKKIRRLVERLRRTVRDFAALARG